MKVALAGATGLIGTHVWELLRSQPEVKSIHILTRRELDPEPKSVLFDIDFDSLDELTTAVSGCTAVCCCLGTTINTAGSKEAFRKVDYTYVTNLALASARAKVERFLVVSAVGADSDSSVFYSQVKGQMEDALKDVGIPAIQVFRPSLLLGDRKEFRFGERLASFFMTLLSPAMMGSLAKYKPIKAKSVARAMVYRCIHLTEGFHIAHYTEMALWAQDLKS